MVGYQTRTTEPIALDFGLDAAALLLRSFTRCGASLGVPRVAEDHPVRGEKSEDGRRKERAAQPYTIFLALRRYLEAKRGVRARELPPRCQPPWCGRSR